MYILSWGIFYHWRQSTLRVHLSEKRRDVVFYRSPTVGPVYTSFTTGGSVTCSLN